MHISFLLHNAYGIGGTIRTTFNLAQTLAQRHDVDIVSVFRHRDEPTMGAPAGVTMKHLVDLRKTSPGYDGDDPQYKRPAKVFPRGDGRHKQYAVSPTPGSPRIWARSKPMWSSAPGPGSMSI